jgi:FtsP/CotA-like multicopper oxidase with cupredoxin domain
VSSVSGSPLLIGVVFISTFCCAQGVSLPQPPQVRAKNHLVSVTLHAVNENGRDAFAFNGKTVAPVIRASPGDILKITYINDLPSKSSESCAVNPCMDMTNLHFHGLTVSPEAPQDDWPSPARSCTTQFAFHAIIRPGCSGTTRILMERVIGKCWTECREPLSWRESNAMSPR